MEPSSSAYCTSSSPHPLTLDAKRLSFQLRQLTMLGALTTDQTDTSNTENLHNRDSSNFNGLGSSLNIAVCTVC